MSINADGTRPSLAKPVGRLVHVGRPVSFGWSLARLGMNMMITSNKSFSEWGEVLGLRPCTARGGRASRARWRTHLRSGRTRHVIQVYPGSDLGQLPQRRDMVG